jgi:hypothetical protein
VPVPTRKMGAGRVLYSTNTTSHNNGKVVEHGLACGTDLDTDARGYGAAEDVHAWLIIKARISARIKKRPLLPNSKETRVIFEVIALPSSRRCQSLVIFACLKYFMPTQAVTTQTQAIIHVKIIRLG